jgi:hypothetical protein
VVVRKIAVKKRAEVDEGLRKACHAPAVQHHLRGIAVAIRADARREVNGLRLALLSGEPTCKRSPKSRKCA